MPFDSSNFGYRTLPVWLQDFVAGLGPSTMSTLRRGFQQEIVRPGVRINFDREFANRNASMSEVLSQVFSQPSQNALTPGRIFNPIQQNNPEPPIPPLIPVPPGEPTSPPPPSGGSGGSGSGGSGGSGSGSSVSFCGGGGAFSNICDPTCLNVNGDSSCNFSLNAMGDLTLGAAQNCISTRFDTSTSPPTAVPLCGCSSWQLQMNYFSWDGFDCFNTFPVMGYTGEVVQVNLGFCCYETLGILGYANLQVLWDVDLSVIEYIQYQVVGEPNPFDVADFMKQVAESACPNGDCGGHIPGWTSCNAPWEVLSASGFRSCPSTFSLTPYFAFP